MAKQSQVLLASFDNSDQYHFLILEGNKLREKRWVRNLPRLTYNRRVDLDRAAEALGSLQEFGGTHPILRDVRRFHAFRRAALEALVDKGAAQIIAERGGVSRVGLL